MYKLAFLCLVLPYALGMSMINPALSMRRCPVMIDSTNFLSTAYGMPPMTAMPVTPYMSNYDMFAPQWTKTHTYWNKDMLLAPWTMPYNGIMTKPFWNRMPFLNQMPTTMMPWTMAMMPLNSGVSRYDVMAPQWTKTQTYWNKDMMMTPLSMGTMMPWDMNMLKLKDQ